MCSGIPIADLATGASTRATNTTATSVERAKAAVAWEAGVVVDIGRHRGELQGAASAILAAPRAAGPVVLVDGLARVHNRLAETLVHDDDVPHVAVLERALERGKREMKGQESLVGDKLGEGDEPVPPAERRIVARWGFERGCVAIVVSASRHQEGRPGR
jgi:hypothetical protein